MLQQLATTFSEGHERCLLLANDVRPCFHQSFLAEPAKFSLSRARGTSAVVQEVVRRHDAEGACRRQNSHLRLPEFYRSLAVSNRLPPASPRQIEVAREHITRVAGLRFMPVLVAASTTQLGSLALVRT